MAKSLSEVLKEKELKADKRNTYEFQAFGNRLAEELNDSEHRTLYIKLAKKEDRNLLEQARDFVTGQKHISKKGKLFMWKLQELKRELKSKNE